MRRHRTITLQRLKDDARKHLRELAREGETPAVTTLAERLAPRDEEVLFSLSRHSPVLARTPNASIEPGEREALVRANLVLALVRALEDELARIRAGGTDYLELADKGIGCGC